MAAGTAPFSGLPFGLPFFSMATSHVGTRDTAHGPASMYVYACVKQASSMKSPPPALGRPGHGAGFFSLVFFSEIQFASISIHQHDDDDPLRCGLLLQSFAHSNVTVKNDSV